ncbi:hypothetical protein K456DRAFT_1282170 [Colletotrichum gloeosporioides 23]|nr:hypothetical protein K456DRAFT_1282170 [Colletotrichum gloeosporioides 23]
MLAALSLPTQYRSLIPFLPCSPVSCTYLCTKCLPQRSLTEVYIHTYGFSACTDTARSDPIHPVQSIHALISSLHCCTTHRPSAACTDCVLLLLLLATLVFPHAARLVVYTHLPHPPVAHIRPLFLSLLLHVLNRRPTQSYCDLAVALRVHGDLPSFPFERRSICTYHRDPPSSFHSHTYTHNHHHHYHHPPRSLSLSLFSLKQLRLSSALLFNPIPSLALRVSRKHARQSCQPANRRHRASNTPIPRTPQTAPTHNEHPSAAAARLPVWIWNFAPPSLVFNLITAAHTFAAAPAKAKTALLFVAPPYQHCQKQYPFGVPPETKLPFETPPKNQPHIREVCHLGLAATQPFLSLVAFAGRHSNFEATNSPSIERLNFSAPNPIARPDSAHLSLSPTPPSIICAVPSPASQPHRANHSPSSRSPTASRQSRLRP